MTTTPPINPLNPASTYPPHEQLIADAYTPDHRTISLAEQHLAFIDVQAMCAVQDLWAQNQARGIDRDRLAAELGRVRAELATAREHEEQLAALLRAGQHWKGTRLVAESRYSAREIRALFGWPEPTPPTASPSA